jgi:TolA-binding protein
VLLRKKTDLILEKPDIISLRNKLTLIEKSRKDEMVKSVNKNTPRFRYAAIFTGVFIIGSLLFFSFKNQSPETLFKRYYQVYDNPGTSRSSEKPYNEAINYLNNREFHKALAGFQAYLKNNPGSAQYEFLSGVSNMEIRNFPDAQLSFNRVINREVNFYKEDANWYLAMCYLATSDKIMAKDQLRKIAESESIYKNKARKILRHL